MDKKFMGVIAVMLAVCLFIISSTGAASQSEQSVPTSSQSVTAAYVERFFDKNKVIDVQISMAEADFEDMLANPTKEEYKQASVTIGGEKADNVGFRVKGNSSLSSVARSDSQRYSFKVDINHYLEGQNLLGLTKLNLNNSFSDPSYMREYLSYSLLNEMRIPTPAFSYANVYVNGELMGLYLAVEGVEEPFLERYYGSNYGNLYKSVGGQGSDLLYIDDKIKSYSGLELKTANKNGADEALLKMIKALNQGQELERYLNIEEILKYFAVNNVLVNMDSYLGNFKHNYYLYEKNGVFSVLPWDYNMSFGGFSGGGGGSQSSTSLHIDSPVSGTTLAQRPLLGKLLEVPEYKELYHKYIEELLNGPFSLEKMQAEIERVAAMIRPHLEKDPTKIYSMEQFEQAISEESQSQNPASEGTIEAAGPPAMENGQLPLDGGRWPLPDGQGRAQPMQERGGIRQQQGGGMMQGASVGLVKFVRERIENVTKQLNGETPVVVSATEQGNRNMGQGQPGNRNGQMPPGGMQQPPNGVRKLSPNMGRQDLLQNFSLQQMYLVGGSILLLVAALLLIFKRKTKYSI